MNKRDKHKHNPPFSKAKTIDKFNSRLHWQNSLNHRLFDILQQLNEIA
jgi:hypothetical protein